MNRAIIFVSFLLMSVVVVFAQRKDGDCPSPGNLNVCGYTCRKDTDCTGDSKCCRTSCLGSVCIKPNLPTSFAAIQEKPGRCPESPTGPWVCSSRCSNDNDCRRTHKCCKNRCGALACIQPA